MTPLSDTGAILETARKILRTNDRGGYTVPTDRLYPFQWNWDSAFVAMGWACFDVARAWDEIAFLLKGQWSDGLIPQIIFHAPSDEYFPGPDVWRTGKSPPTSGITQPPVLATAVRAVLARDVDGAARAAAIYPSLIRNHRWWQTARDPQKTGLVTTLHPWETGMDNSPAWDRPMQQVPTTTRTIIRRRDTSHIDAAMRPKAEDYQRFIHLVDTFRDVGWNAMEMLRVSPFRVADIGTNAILLRAEKDLLQLAYVFGTPDEASEISIRIMRMTQAQAALWDDGKRIYVSRDLISGLPMDVATSAGFLPLYAGIADHAEALAATLTQWGKSVPWLVPSTDPADRRFEAMRYWRGPIWAVVNWMLADGLFASGYDDLAERLLRTTRDLIDGSGFSEYFDPTTAAGIGGRDFSWTAAIRLLCSEA